MVVESDTVGEPGAVVVHSEDIAAHRGTEMRSVGFELVLFIAIPARSYPRVDKGVVR